ncbi:MAG: hypothetical protein ABI700_20365, partial [Chloroflexota bacterium]
LHLNGAIVLEPLSEEQIDDYLRSLGSEMQGVREAMITDPDLHKLAESPLMLSIMTLAFRGLHSEDLPPLQSIEAQRRRLFETYTRRMFDRRPLLQGTPDHFRHYLNWLAGRMVERKQSVFYIENLQSDWIAGDRLRRLYRIVGRSVFGAIGGAAIGALSGLALVLVFALTGNIYFQTLSLNNLIAGAFAFIAFPAGLGALVFAISGLQAFALDSISEELHSFQQILRRIFEVITVGAILGLVAAILAGIGLLILALLLDALRPEYMQYNLSQNLDPLTGWAAIGVEATIVIGIALGLGAFAGTLSAAVAIAVNLIQPQRRVQLGVMTLGFYGGLLGLSISVIIALLWVIFSSTDTSLGRLPEFILSSAITGGILALTVCILPKRWAVTPYVLLSLVPFGMVIGLAISLGLGLLMGGSDVVVKHAVLRFFLRRSDNIPRNYAALLDDATDRVLLRKVGGGYIFIHRYLLEYYASLEGQSDNPPSTS